ncbi:MAG TPA: 50S ribosomal protein L1 [Candidatus Syntrophoarchaeum butanivorans]|uniref:Large ribosomal subunit protein uL1 n=1 Tax=Candidatus Syntropharchaeum butanivorans TaxID=1839936 RepID=A0A7C1B7F1_9EURY|nr:MAG: 50S ribosomal protein L1 [Candidatus Syntrophoarchaeum sp. WYZ-LMO15]HDM36983.1 50S ribosomal protein L1 [Candidatus Syntrophoarchaeum butanivorans]
MSKKTKKDGKGSDEVYSVRDGISLVLNNSPERKFTESVELAFNLKNVDMGKPKNRIDEEILLPHGPGRERKIAVFASGEVALKAQKAGADAFSPEEIDKLAEDKKKAKAFAREYDFIIAEASLMPIIGKKLGIILGPRGKMPTPLPPGVEVEPIVDRLKRTVRVRSRDKTTFHVLIGRRDMDVDELTENAETVIKRVESRLESGRQNIKSVYVTTTMGISGRVM